MTKERSLLDAAAERFEQLADRLDDWAIESRTGGWSTHQVDANTREADKCRRNAAEIRRYLRGQP